jgi:hypothetical protein
MRCTVRQYTPQTLLYSNPRALECISKASFVLNEEKEIRRKDKSKNCNTRVSGCDASDGEME